MELSVTAENAVWYVLFGQFVGSLLNTVMSSDTTIGKIINLFALGFGKARPDPTKQ